MIRRPPRSTLFPTRRSSDLALVDFAQRFDRAQIHVLIELVDRGVHRTELDHLWTEFGDEAAVGDRKSTRLNSSHSQISYAVFCLKKKKNPAPYTQSRLYHQR